MKCFNKKGNNMDLIAQIKEKEKNFKRLQFYQKQKMKEYQREFAQQITNEGFANIIYQLVKEYL